jgi:hypothetical protein
MYAVCGHRTIGRTDRLAVLRIATESTSQRAETQSTALLREAASTPWNFCFGNATTSAALGGRRDTLGASIACPSFTQNRHEGTGVEPLKSPTVPQRQSIHSFTWAARSGGNDKPRFLSAVRFALMVNSVGPAIGRSTGTAPWRILSTYLAAP